MPTDADNAVGGVALTDRSPDAGAAVRALGDAAQGEAGAIVTFTGVVRAERDTERRVEWLEFECYPEMAQAELARVRAEAVARFGLHGCLIEHRTGRLRVGDPIVLVATAARHRTDAFAAAAWVMDEIKRRVPIWKREVDTTGATRWVPGPDAAAEGQG